MAVTHNEFIQEAIRLLDGGPSSEITHRSAIGRAYYGVYHCALNYADSLLDVPLSACAGGSHKKVSDYYSNKFAKGDTLKFRKVGIALLQLHGHRVRADYRLEDAIHYDDAQAMLRSSREVLDVLVELGASV